MKTTALLSIVALASMPLCAADLAGDVKAAAQKLSEKPNYSWTSKTDPPPGQGGQGGQGGGQRRAGGFGGGGLPDGKTEKSGFTVLTFQAGENTTEVVRKGDKVAIKSGEEWKTADELADADGGGGGGRGNRGQFMARRAQTVKLPSADAEELLGRVKELKKDGDTYVGDLTADGIKQMFTFGGGRRPGGAGGNIPSPDTSGLKGTVKFWVKDGVLNKYETRVEGKMSFGQEGRERDINRTTTVEIRDIGSTKVEVPEAARKKLTT